MGQKVDPRCIRIGITRSWPSTWYSNKRNYKKYLHQDIKLRAEIEKELMDCGVSEIRIQRNANNVTIDVHSAKPGLIIGRQGEKIEVLRDKLKLKFGENFQINIKEIKKPDLEARLIGESIARQIEKRISYRRAARMALSKAMENGAQGAKILVSGRLNGVEIARNEYFTEGKIPLHTFRADIDYAYIPAKTTYGVIGVKVWVYRGEVFKKKEKVLITQE